MNNKKVVVDSNVWISYLLNKELHLFVLKVLKSDIQIFTCRELTDEIIGVLRRAKFSKYVTENDIQEFMAIHMKLCHVIQLDEIPDILSDKKDNFLVALYRTAKAAMLVTGDKQLIEEATKNNINAITITQFKQLTS